MTCSGCEALAVLHALTRGLPPAVCVSAHTTPAWGTYFCKSVTELRNRQQVMFCEVPGEIVTRHMICVPMGPAAAAWHTLASANVQAMHCLWCYDVPVDSFLAARSWLSAGKLPVIFDLDDTLVSAMAASQIQKMLEDVRTCVLHVCSHGWRFGHKERDVSATGGSAAMLSV